MKKILYTSYNIWKKLENKQNYYFLAISFTIPDYFSGLRYLRLTPSKQLFFLTHKEGYQQNKYFERYLKQISKYKKQNILEQLNKISEKPIVLLGWEDKKVYGQCRFVIEWLYNISKDQTIQFALQNNIYEDKEFMNL